MTRYFIFGSRGGAVVPLVRGDWQAAYRTMVRLTELGFAVAYELRSSHTVNACPQQEEIQ